jgi:RNA polymerase sigma factor (sigma-70 family)
MSPSNGCEQDFGLTEARPTTEFAEKCWSDTRLVNECLSGNEAAWSALVDKYKRLIYSIPIRWGFDQEDATDVFQSVIAQLLSELGRLREPEALAGWLIRVTSNQCSQLRKQQQRENPASASQLEPETLAQPGPDLESILCEAAREQALRRVILGSSDQCRRLIHLLFYETPSRPYEEVAASLGIATGSIGFIRRKCLDRLRSSLQEAGF